MHLSGNCYKIRLAAHQLGVPLQLVDYALLDGATRTPEYLARNPNGRVPMLELDDGRWLECVRAQPKHVPIEFRD
jgi:glutathione S-transferase